MLMWQRHVANRLAALVDGELGSAEAARVRAHLETCEPCRGARDRYEFAATLLRRLPRAEAPPGIWNAIEEAIGPTYRAPAWTGVEYRRPSGLQLWFGRRLALATLAGLALATVVTFWQRNDGSNVARIDSSGGEAPLGIGEWVETDAASRATLRIGSIGTVDVEPNTRMQVLAARPTEHRLNLTRGTISAQILAPPRLFFVNTPASTVVDLGCAYTMTVDEAGTGILRVTGGWASLEWGGRESIVPAGASCPTRPAVGPGTPSFDDASDRLKEALVAFDFDNGGRAALEVVLTEARDRDTLTLWHLLSRVTPSERGLVFDRMLTFGPLPKGVRREDAVALEPETLKRWREELAWTW